ncbi:MAG TPA: glutamate-5-semialdehyde dehydrogenase [Gemmataceae bacterium]|nr:glutamate-5-semialdehyde dehydrogenase [Gemmataceae bacterium]
MSAVASFNPAADLSAYCVDLARRARAASRQLATASSACKNGWLLGTAEVLEQRGDEVLAANEKDLRAAAELGLSAAQVDRLRLTPARLSDAVAGLREVATLPDPVGQVRAGSVRPNGLQVHKVSVPLGVLLFIYESRPNVTIDAAALSIKSGNAIILRGGREAANSNRALLPILRHALSFEELPQDAVQMVETSDRAAIGHLLKMSDLIDLVIPRGGEELIRRVAEEARMPVLKHYKGICHVFVEKSADLDRAERIVLNAKCQRPGVCNAMECLLLDEAVAASFLPRVAAGLLRRGVELRGCPATCRLVPEAIPARAEDFDTEFLDLVVSIKIVADLDDAVAHINRHGSGHTDAIVTNDLTAARRFTAAVDSAAVMVNASTRFHDGQELGLGAEIGISTDKLHARGPCGLQELTSYKYIVYGEGHVRGE